MDPETIEAKVDRITQQILSEMYGENRLDEEVRQIHTYTHTHTHTRTCTHKNMCTHKHTHRLQGGEVFP